MPKASCISLLDKHFNLYLEELSEWNKKFNLTSITDPEEIRKKHFENSLSVLQAIKLTNEAVIDVGAGAGFPGIPLKIACPEIKLTLVEATRKKTEFLQHIIRILDLKDTEVIWARAEKIAHQEKYREKFDLAVARAVAGLNTLCEFCLPFVKTGGKFIALKGQKAEAEAKAAEKAIQILGGRLKQSGPITIIEKIAPTPPQYPRPAGMAKKSPL